MSKLFMANEELNEVVLDEGFDGEQNQVEISELQSEVKEDAGAIDRTLDAAISLEEIMEIFKEDPKLSQREGILLNQVTALATSGTETDPEALIPAAESGDFCLATEEIMGKVISAVKATVEGIKNLVNKFVDIFRKMAFSAKEYVEQLTYLREEMQALQRAGKTHLHQVTVKSRNGFIKNGKPITDIKTLVSEVQAWSGFSEKYLNAFIESAQTIDRAEQGFFSTIKKALFNSEEYATQLLNMVEGTGAGMIKRLAPKKVADRPNYSDYEYDVPLSGNTIMFTQPKFDNVDRTDYKQVSSLAKRTNIFARKTDFGEFKQTTTTTWDNISLKDVETIIDAAIDHFSSYLKKYETIVDIYFDANRRTSIILLLLNVPGNMVSGGASSVVLASGLVLSSVRAIWKQMLYMNSLTEVLQYTYMKPAVQINWFARDVMKRGKWTAA